nr:AT hook domain containing protein [Haemonchus contortus]
MLERDNNHLAPSSNFGSCNYDEIECDNLSTNEAGPSDAVEPKSAIDVALELIAQEELEAINAARIAALNKPKPRGRPPLSRKAAENTAIPTKSKSDLSDMQVSIQHKEVESSQKVVPNTANMNGMNGIDQSAASLPPILKDHLEVEAAARVEPQSMEVSLFGTDSCEPETTDFHKMVLLNYGSVDGRLEDDEEEDEEEEEKDVKDSGGQWNSSKESSLPRKESPPKKGSRKSEEISSEITNHNESATTASVTPSDSSSLTVKDEKDTPTSMETDEVDRPATSSSSRKRRTHEKKTRGRPRKSRDAPSPVKTGRPRGRPRKNGSDPVPRVERKSIEKKLNERLQKRRPRRAAAMIQDFLELYAKVDLADLEFIHARATTFVRMLVDEYVEESKMNAASRPLVAILRAHVIQKVQNQKRQNGNLKGRDLRATGIAIATFPNADLPGVFKISLSYLNVVLADMDVPASSNAVDDMASAEEPESSADEVSPERGYDSNSDPGAEFAEENHSDDLPLGRTTSLSDSFIDSIPVIRGAVLQQLPTVIDSV